MHFFFYGTLTAQSDNEVARSLHALLAPGIPATVRGRLYAIEDELGWYPGLVPDPDGGRVHGFLHKATGRFAPRDLAALDRYENFDPLRPELSDFLREEIRVEAGAERFSAHAYVLRLPPVNDAINVANGDFSEFVRDRGLRPYRQEPDFRP